MPPRRLLLLAALTLALPATAHAAGPGSTVLVDRPTGLGPLPFDGANNAALESRNQLSKDGRYAVFESDADQLLAPGANPRERHVFVRDRQKNTTTQVDVSSTGVPGDLSAYHPTISANGNRVAFVTESTNLHGAATSGTNVLVKDLDSGAVLLGSRATGAGGAATNDAGSPALDADGSTVAFLTQVKLDAANDANVLPDVYVRDLGAATTTLFSRGAGGAVGVTYGSVPAISGNGALVAFETGAAIDAAKDLNGQTDVYTRVAGTTTLVSRVNGANTNAGNGRSSNPSVSGDGSVVAFTSSATDLVGGDGNNRADAFTRSGTTTTLHSRKNGTDEIGNGDTYGTTVSLDGLAVAFVSSATNLVTGATTPVYRAYVRTNANLTHLASRADGAAGTPLGSWSPSVSQDGTKVLFGSDDDAAGGTGDDVDDVFLRDIGAGTTAPVSIPSGTTVRKAEAQGSRLWTPSVSDDGRYVVFASESDGLGFPSTSSQVYVRDTRTNVTTRISDGNTGDHFGAVISGDGSTVVYGAEPTGPVVRGYSTDTGIFAHRIATGETILVSRANGPGGASANGASFDAAVSRDGTKVAFTTWATNLDAADGDTDDDVYLRDLTAGTTTLVSRRDGAGTPGGNGRSGGASIDSAGTRVAFTSTSSDLASGDAAGGDDVFVRDVPAQTTTLVSRPSGAATPAGENDSRDAAISGDGTKVAFGSSATDLDPADTSADGDVYLRDLTASTTALLSRVGANGPSVPGNVYLAHLSRDGSAVAYLTRAPEVLGVTVDQEQVVVRRIGDGSTVIGSRGDGAAGPLPDTAYSASLSADGGCLAFIGVGSGLVPGGYASPDYDHVYLRTLAGECPVPAPAVGGPGGGPQQGPAGGANGPGPAARDTEAPRISNATISPATFAVAPAGRGRAAAAARAGQRKRAARGTTLRFTLSEPATAVLTAERRERGRRSGRRCVKSTPALVRRKARPCTRWVARGAVRVTAKAGANRVAYTGRIGRRALPRGRFRLHVDATDAARNKAKRRTLTFTIVRR